MISVKIDPFEIYEESNREKDLMNYMLKLRLCENDIPVDIDPLSIRSADLFIMHGSLDISVVGNSINDMIFVYTWKE